MTDFPKALAIGLLLWMPGRGDAGSTGLFGGSPTGSGGDSGSGGTSTGGDGGTSTGDGGTSTGGGGTSTGGDGGTSTGGDGGTSTGGDGGTSTGDGVIEIYLAGDLTPETFADALSGQTPTDYSVALSAYEIMTSATDANPVPCFSHSEPVVAQLEDDNLVGACDTAGIPTNGYTHGRVKVDWAQYTVAGTLHSTIPLAGQYTFFRAYSDTHHGGKDYKAGQGTIRFVSGAVDQTYPWTYAPLPEVSGISYELDGGEYWMTFPFARPLPVEQGEPGKQWARLNWKIYESFRWADAGYLGYATDVWDTVPLNTVLTGSVLVPGVTGYYVTTSRD